MSLKYQPASELLHMSGYPGQLDPRSLLSGYSPKVIILVKLVSWVLKAGAP